MVSEVIEEEHVPEDSSVVAGTRDIVKSVPDRSIAKERSYFPKEKDGQHVGGPNPDEAMQKASQVESPKFFNLFQLVQHA